MRECVGSEKMSGSWSDNDGVTALSRAADGLAALAAAIPSRSTRRDEIDAPATTLPIENLPAHIRFARIWSERREEFLARRQQRPCPLCRSRAADMWFPTQDGYRYDICGSCGMVYIPEIVPLRVWDDYFSTLPAAREHLHAQLEATITPEAMEASRKRFGRYYELAKQHGLPAKGARMLDIGTHTGGSLIVAAEWGITAHGIEGLEEAVHFARMHRPGLQIAHGTAEQFDPESFGGLFDIVTMWETLEHTVDPIEALRRAWQAMKPGGLVVVTVPNVRNVQCSLLREHCYFAYGGYQGVGHINLFSPDSLRSAFIAGGFEPLHMETEFGTDWRQIAYYVQQRLNRIYCFRNLLRDDAFTRPPNPELGIILNWISPALTAVENAWWGGPILIGIARRGATVRV